MNRRVSSGVLVTCVLVLSACGELPDGGPPPGASGPPPDVIDEGPEPQWNDLVISGVSVDSLSEAANDLAFTPTIAPELGVPTRLVVTDPQAAEKALRVFAARFDSPVFGMFWLIERNSETSQEELAANAEPDPKAGCLGTRALVKLSGGTTALLIQGPAATTVVWLEGNLRFDVMGPSETFSQTSAVAVADAVAKVAV